MTAGRYVEVSRTKQKKVWLEMCRVGIKKKRKGIDKRS